MEKTIFEFDTYISTKIETNKLSDVILDFYDRWAGTLTISLHNQDKTKITNITLESTINESNYMIEYPDGSYLEWTSYGWDAYYEDIVGELENIYWDLSNIVNLEVDYLKKE